MECVHYLYRNIWPTTGLMQSKFYFNIHYSFVISLFNFIQVKMIIDASINQFRKHNKVLS